MKFFRGLYIGLPISLALWGMIIIVARGDEQPTISIALTSQEQGIILEMCSAATWASRIRFDGMCEVLKRKIDEAKKPIEPKKE